MVMLNVCMCARTGLVNHIVVQVSPSAVEVCLLHNVPVAWGKPHDGDFKKATVFDIGEKT
jgi:hypothetical protein